jgi:hypothetical protein
LVIALADLLEAEGRALRHSTLRAGVGLLCLLMAAVMLLGGALFCLWASYQWLSVVISPVAAKVLVGVVMMSIAGGLVWVSIRVSR